MATGTAVTVTRQRHQFQGVFEDVWVARFTLDTASIQPNATSEDTVTVPGIRRATDMVLGFTHAAEPAHDVSHDVHVGADDTLHVLCHNSSGGAIDPASTTYVVVVGRVRLDA